MMQVMFVQPFTQKCRSQQTQDSLHLLAWQLAGPVYVVGQAAASGLRSTGMRKPMSPFSAPRTNQLHR